MSAPSTLWPRRALSYLWSREPALTSHASCRHLGLKTSQPPDRGAYTVWVVKDTACAISPQLSKGPRQDGQNNLVLGGIKIWKSQQFPPEPLPCSHHERPGFVDSVYNQVLPRLLRTTRHRVLSLLSRPAATATAAMLL